MSQSYQVRKKKKRRQRIEANKTQKGFIEKRKIGSLLEVAMKPGKKPLPSHLFKKSKIKKNNKSLVEKFKGVLKHGK